MGLGQSRTFSLGDAVFRPENLGLAPATVSVALFHTDLTASLVRMSAPSGQSLAPGTYNNVLGAPTATNPSLDVSTAARGCTATAGHFVVFDIAVGPTGELKRFRATFEQHCGGVPALRGEIHIVADPWR